MSRLLNLKRIFSIMNPFQIDPNMLDWKNAEKAAPYFNWLAFLDVVATQCTTEYHFNFHADGDKYRTVDYWRLVLYQHDSTLSTKEGMQFPQSRNVYGTRFIGPCLPDRWSI